MNNNNTMRMPGFTAEASLYQTSERYQVVAVSDSFSGSGEVIPQIACACGSGGPTGHFCCCCHAGGCACAPAILV